MSFFADLEFFAVALNLFGAIAASGKPGEPAAIAANPNLNSISSPS